MDANMINKELRQALVYNGDEPTAEVDIVTSQPTILASLYPEKCAEFIRYKKLVEHGDIYIEIATLTGGDREKAKKLAYKFMFGGTSPIVRKWFKKNFPKLASVVAKYKGNLLSHELQRRESTVILRDMMLNSGIPSISIHDGLRCRVDDKEKCADLIIKSFQKRWDITPQITIEFGNSKYNYHPSS